MRIGNRVTEKDIRIWLSKNGFKGQTAIIEDLELYALKRPGWVQVFRFRVKARLSTSSNVVQLTDGVESWGPDSPSCFFGTVLDDERIRKVDKRTKVWIFEDEDEQREHLATIANGMLTCRTGQNGPAVWIILIFVLLFIVALTFASLLS